MWASIRAQAEEVWHELALSFELATAGAQDMQWIDTLQFFWDSLPAADTLTAKERRAIAAALKHTVRQQSQWLMDRQVSHSAAIRARQADSAARHLEHLASMRRDEMCTMSFIAREQSQLLPPPPPALDAAPVATAPADGEEAGPCRVLLERSARRGPRSSSGSASSSLRAIRGRLPSIVEPQHGLHRQQEGEEQGDDDVVAAALEAAACGFVAVDVPLLLDAAAADAHGGAGGGHHGGGDDRAAMPDSSRHRSHGTAVVPSAVATSSSSSSGSNSSAWVCEIACGPGDQPTDLLRPLLGGDAQCVDAAWPSDVAATAPVACHHPPPPQQPHRHHHRQQQQQSYQPPDPQAVAMAVPLQGAASQPVPATLSTSPAGDSSSPGSSLGAAALLGRSRAAGGSCPLLLHLYLNSSEHPPAAVAAAAAAAAVAADAIPVPGCKGAKLGQASTTAGVTRPASSVASTASSAPLEPLWCDSDFSCSSMPPAVTRGSGPSSSSSLAACGAVGAGGGCVTTTAPVVLGRTGAPQGVHGVHAHSCGHRE